MNPYTKQTGVQQTTVSAQESKAFGNGSETVSKMTMLWTSDRRENE